MRSTNFGAVIRLADEALQGLRERDHAAGGAADGGAAGGAGDGGEDGRVTLNTDDVPQAFSHFSLYYSQRPTSQIRGKGGVSGNCLVCDLQGCYDKRSATFTLFDPVIHSELGEKGLFGATDRGAKGINEFLASQVNNSSIL